MSGMRVFIDMRPEWKPEKSPEAKKGKKADIPMPARWYVRLGSMKGPAPVARFCDSREEAEKWRDQLARETGAVVQ